MVRISLLSGGSQQFSALAGSQVPGERFKLARPGLHPRPIKLESQGWGLAPTAPHTPQLVIMGSARDGMSVSQSHMVKP